MGVVIFNKKNICKINKEDIKDLKEKARHATDGKARLCLHKSNENLLHEMIIVLRKGTYVRPHAHKKKTETFHLIEGRVKVIIFKESGLVKDSLVMDSLVQKGDFICRLEEGVWHMVIPLSDFSVFHEVTNGPYLGKDDSVFAGWAPFTKEKDKVKLFMEEICRLK
ncbi:MAG: WbuC family cupin fold metalloprotein [Candidatus Omnitrophica bacterium]|jgi:cupin fold WbuC family metalloprotein|nr:WbuC family cupin fold metalloprotein [Candidatus Omnitrophota bacterium]MCF7876728.1 WbuC family cupin fold metalloprotein [Candidatus Omnitrophota bacterium]MCF7891461.1 WbuC family cupin fold metalloprotein [Candidatus Omnitrophota bacterium]MCF7895397.1 WbuC family cupin fold metalloprotein [Candidatus Omnitrophota bacterium]MCF7897167.1 WbuC family cupin fold metalloprotein [Candidatus Omnitrophota bacterium]